MNLLGPDDTCPRCGDRSIPANTDASTGRSTYICHECGHVWWVIRAPEAREDHRVRASRLLERDRFADPDPEGRYVYDDEDDW